MIMSWEYHNKVSIPSNRVIVSIRGPRPLIPPMQMGGSQSPQIGSLFQFSDDNKFIHNIFESQSPQIGSLFQYNSKKLKGGSDESQSPQIGSLFQCAPDVDPTKGVIVSIPSNRVIVSILRKQCWMLK